MDFWIGSCHSQSQSGGCNYEGNSPGRFNGNISSVKVSSQILYEADFEVNNELSFNDSTFLLWNLNEGTGSTANDISGNGRNGTINGNATWSMDVPTISTGPLWHVSTTGSDSNGDGTYENPFATIQTAIDASSDGDSVLVAVGTYVAVSYTHLTLLTKA